jgi:hypothetical protein
MTRQTDKNVRPLAKLLQQGRGPAGWAFSKASSAGHQVREVDVRLQHSEVWGDIYPSSLHNTTGLLSVYISIIFTVRLCLGYSVCFVFLAVFITVQFHTFLVCLYVVYNTYDVSRFEILISTIKQCTLIPLFPLMYIFTYKKFCIDVH